MRYWCVTWELSALLVRYLGIECINGALPGNCGRYWCVTWELSALLVRYLGIECVIGALPGN